MAHEGIFFTKAELDVFVGENVDTTGYTEANINKAALQVQAYINGILRMNITSAIYSALDSGIKEVLSIAAASLASIQFITYNMAGYTSRIEAENMVNANWATHKKMMLLINDAKWRTFAGLN